MSLHPPQPLNIPCPGPSCPQAVGGLGFSGGRGPPGPPGPGPTQIIRERGPDPPPFRQLRDDKTQLHRERHDIDATKGKPFLTFPPRPKQNLTFPHRTVNKKKYEREFNASQMSDCDFMLQGIMFLHTEGANSKKHKLQYDYVHDFVEEQLLDEIKTVDHELFAFVVYFMQKLFKNQKIPQSKVDYLLHVLDTACLKKPWKSWLGRLSEEPCVRLQELFDHHQNYALTSDEWTEAMYIWKEHDIHQKATYDFEKSGGVQNFADALKVFHDQFGLPPNQYPAFRKIVYNYCLDVPAMDEDPKPIDDPKPPVDENECMILMSLCDDLRTGELDQRGWDKFRQLFTKFIPQMGQVLAQFLWNYVMWIYKGGDVAEHQFDILKSTLWYACADPDLDKRPRDPCERLDYMLLEASQNLLNDEDWKDFYNTFDPYLEPYSDEIKTGVTEFLQILANGQLPERHLLTLRAMVHQICKGEIGKKKKKKKLDGWYFPDKDKDEPPLPPPDPTPIDDPEKPQTDVYCENFRTELEAARPGNQDQEMAWTWVDDRVHMYMEATDLIGPTRLQNFKVILHRLTNNTTVPDQYWVPFVQTMYRICKFNQGSPEPMDYRPGGFCKRIEFLLYEAYEFGLHQTLSAGWPELLFYLDQLYPKMTDYEQNFVRPKINQRLGSIQGARPTQAQFDMLRTVIVRACNRTPNITPFPVPQHPEEEEEKEIDCALLLKTFDELGNLSQQQTLWLFNSMQKLIRPEIVGAARVQHFVRFMGNIHSGTQVSPQENDMARNTLEYACRGIIAPTGRPDDLCDKLEVLLNELYSKNLVTAEFAMVKREVQVILAATPELPAERYHTILDRLQAGAVVPYGDFYQMLESILTACRHKPGDTKPKPKPKPKPGPAGPGQGPLTIQDYCTHIIYLWHTAKNVGLTDEQWATFRRIILPFQLQPATQQIIQTAQQGGSLTEQQWIDAGNDLWNA